MTQGSAGIVAYINRTLVASMGAEDEQKIGEEMLLGLSKVVVLLGEPGVGKTELTKHLETAFGAVRVAAGTFWRSADSSVYEATSDLPLIIDGLDEITASGGDPPLDRILHSLSKLQNPRVIISCRSADWTSSVNRYKISQDYGLSPVSVHILPFDDAQARLFLAAFDGTIDASRLLSAIRAQGLTDLQGNPLTLRLLAEVWLEDGGLPNSKTELLERACEILVGEENQAHDNSRQAQVSPRELLAAAGHIFAHLLLSGTLGVAMTNARRRPDGFVPLSELDVMGRADHLEAALKTRLFKSESEGQLIPVHRVVAEYLAAQRLASKLDDKLSERRLFRLIEFSGGVPSALRGLHAWLGYFSARVFPRCVDIDPYGFLRYGDTELLSASQARYLLNALARLASEDPYFRSEDWGVRSVKGLVRPELLQEIIALITSPARHVQLSALLLSSFARSGQTAAVSPNLLAVAKDGAAAYVERISAVEALAKSEVSVDWQHFVASLLSDAHPDNGRLAVETMGLIGPSNVDAAVTADALIRLHGLGEPGRRNARGVGSDFRLVSRINSLLAQKVLDGIARRIGEEPRPLHWHPARGLMSAITRLLSSAIDGPAIIPERFWSWVAFFNDRSTYPENDANNRIGLFLRSNIDLRRAIQRSVLYDPTVENDPWAAIFHRLGRSLRGLALSMDDAAFFILEISEADHPTSHQIVLWNELVRVMGHPEGYNPNLRYAVETGVERHAALAAHYQKLITPAPRDFEEEERQRQQRYDEERTKGFADDRAAFSRELVDIRAGQHTGALISLAEGYLGRYSEVDCDGDPFERLTGWVGEAVADAASEGFVAALGRSDLPDLVKICAIRNENKHWSIEPVMVAGVAEIVRRGASIDSLAESVAAAVLAIWWEMPQIDPPLSDNAVEGFLEAIVFRDSQSTEHFLTALIETQLSGDQSSISGLYRFVREQKFRSFSPRLAVKWLRLFPRASYSTQLDLMSLALMADDLGDFQTLLAERIGNITALESTVARLWIAAVFCVSPELLGDTSSDGRCLDKEVIWPLRDLLMPDDDGRPGAILGIQVYEAVIRTFALDWPDTARPASGWGGTGNAWDASDFIKHCIGKIGADTTSEASEAFDRLQERCGTSSYRDELRHVARVQLRGRRDKDYVAPSFNEVARILHNAAPMGVRDLQALMLDHLEDLQKYVRDSDTSGWEAFWDQTVPKIENTCRDRLLDLLRPRLPGAIELFPELPMPDQNRVDIYASLFGQGLPIEIKGQWHPEVWGASSTQLNEKYTRDWRTGGRGIYIVFWFGPVAGKNLPRRADGLGLPSNPAELRTMLIERLGDGEKSRIDIVVFDVAMPQSARMKIERKNATRKSPGSRSARRALAE